MTTNNNLPLISEEQFEKVSSAIEKALRNAIFEVMSADIAGKPFENESERINELMKPIAVEEIIRLSSEEKITLLAAGKIFHKIRRIIINTYAEAIC